MKKRQLGSCVTFFPQPATLIATVDSDGKANLMMASWVGIVSKTPPTIAVSLHRSRSTYANIKANPNFSVNVVPVDLVAAGDACGLASGHKSDKLAMTGLELTAGTLPGVSLVADSPLNVECRYLREVELGDYQLVLAEIVEIHACEQAFGDEGTIDARSFDPLVYLGGIREYWSLGEKAGDAYRIGASILDPAE